MPDLYDLVTAKYHKPDKRVHRGFYYLDDETVINSLSAVEAGKVDEVVSKVNSAREGGLGGGVGVYGAKVEAGKKVTSAFEEEIVRTRTRFSIFELWYENLRNSKAIGTFEGWGTSILADVRPGWGGDRRDACRRRGRDGAAVVLRAGESPCTWGRAAACQSMEEM